MIKDKDYLHVTYAFLLCDVKELNIKWQYRNGKKTSYAMFPT